MVGMTKDWLTNTRWRKLACALVVCGISSQIQSMGQNSLSPSPDKPQVQAFITAAGKHGSPVMLTSSDLSISVDKQPARVDEVRSAKNDALVFAVLVDTSTSAATNADAIRKAALQVFQSLSVGDNQGYLVLFDKFITISQAPLQIPEVERSLKLASFNGGTAVYDAIEQTCLRKLNEANNLRSPRRAIILISDGDDNSSHVPRTEAETRAETEGVAVFSLATPRSARSAPRGEYVLKEISRSTGARAIVGPSLAEGVQQVLSAIDEQWALSFVPAQPPDQKLHSLHVKSGQKSVDISAPSHFFLK